MFFLFASLFLLSPPRPPSTPVMELIHVNVQKNIGIFEKTVRKYYVSDLQRQLRAGL